LVTRKDNHGQRLSYGYGNFLVLTDSMEPEYKVGTAIVTHKDKASAIYELYLENKAYNAPIEAEYAEKLSACKTDEERFQVRAEMETRTKNIDVTFFDSYEKTAETAAIRPAETFLYEETANLNNVITHRLREIIYRENVEEGQGRYIFIASGTNLSEHQSQAGQYQMFTESELLGVVKINSPFLGTFFSFLSSIWGLLILLLIPALYLVITSVIDMVKALKTAEEEEEKPLPASGPSGSAGGDVLSGLSEEEKERLKSEMLQEMLSQHEEKGGKK